MRSSNSRRYEVRNITRPLRSGSTELAFTETTGACESIEREMEDGVNFDLG